MFYKKWIHHFVIKRAPVERVLGLIHVRKTNVDFGINDASNHNTNQRLTKSLCFGREQSHRRNGYLFGNIRASWVSEHLLRGGELLIQDVARDFVI
jgi:hypothetical protein